MAKKKFGIVISHPVSERNRIYLNETIRRFRASNETEMTFGAELTNADRAIVHLTCKKYGLFSRSHGTGKNRCVTVYKNPNSVKKTDTAAPFQLSFESQVAIQELFITFPPSENEAFSFTNVHYTRRSNNNLITVPQEDNSSPFSGKTPLAKKQNNLDSKKWIENQIFAYASRRRKLPMMQKVIKERTELPIANFQKLINSTIENNQIVIISGETGCGKTTQVPQYILDYCWSKNEKCKIYCAQPRRISATSISERIAFERGETIGQTVGYQIRLESKGSVHSSIIFCTNGILLRKLVKLGSHLNIQSQPSSVCQTNSECSGLKNPDGQQNDNHDFLCNDYSLEDESDAFDATHIILDEIHERDRYTDFMLIILRDLIAKHSNLRLILMSATLDTNLFSNYFGTCPVIRIPGFTYPNSFVLLGHLFYVMCMSVYQVKSYFLEDVLSMIDYGKVIKFKPPSSGSMLPTSDVSAEKDNNEEQAPSEISSIFSAFKISEEDSVTMNEALDNAWTQNRFDELMELISNDFNLCNYLHPETNVTPLMIASGKGREDVVMGLIAMGANLALKSKDGWDALQWASLSGHYHIVDILKTHKEKRIESRSTEKESNTRDRDEQAETESNSKNALLLKYQEVHDQEEIDFSLLERLLFYICKLRSSENDSSGILVFLPGWEQISIAKNRLLSSSFFSNTSRFSIIPLHSQIPTDVQRLVFVRPPLGVRKIILATNIAESSITIDDVVYVVDFGRVKEKSYDAFRNVSTFQMNWISKANVKQREGRAGRVQEGVCYHLFSRARFESMASFQTPEIKRTPVEDLCLQVKLVDVHLNIQEFLKRAIEPPLEVSVANAIVYLKEINALDEKEDITILGRFLGSLPLHPSTGKMLLLSILFDCLDPILTVACASDAGSPFVLPLTAEAKKRAAAAKQRFAVIYGGGSDHLTIVGAFAEFQTATRMRRGKQFCEDNCLSLSSMHMLQGMRLQLLNLLRKKKFLPSHPHPCNANSLNSGIVRSVLACGFYPMVASLLPIADKAIVVTSQGEKARIHSQSVNFQILKNMSMPTSFNTSFEDPSSRQLIVFDEVTRGEVSSMVRSCTLVQPHPLSLIASEMVVCPLGCEQGDAVMEKNGKGNGREGKSNGMSKSFEERSIAETLTAENTIIMANKKIPGFSVGNKTRERNMRKRNIKEKKMSPLKSNKETSTQVFQNPSTIQMVKCDELGDNETKKEVAKDARLQMQASTCNDVVRGYMLSQAGADYRVKPEEKDYRAVEKGEECESNTIRTCMKEIEKLESEINEDEKAKDILEPKDAYQEGSEDDDDDDDDGEEKEEKNSEYEDEREEEKPRYDDEDEGEEEEDDKEYDGNDDEKEEDDEDDKGEQEEDDDDEIEVRTKGILEENMDKGELKNFISEKIDGIRARIVDENEKQKKVSINSNRRYYPLKSDDEDDDYFNVFDYEDDDISNAKNILQGGENERKKMVLMNSPDNNVVIVLDRWLRFKTSAIEAAMIFCLRSRLAAIVDFKVKHPDALLPMMYVASLYTIACLFSFDGPLNYTPLTREEKTAQNQPFNNNQLSQSQNFTQINNCRGNDNDDDDSPLLRVRLRSNSIDTSSSKSKNWSNTNKSKAKSKNSSGVNHNIRSTVVGISTKKSNRDINAAGYNVDHAGPGFG